MNFTIDTATIIIALFAFMMAIISWFFKGQFKEIKETLAQQGRDNNDMKTDMQVLKNISQLEIKQLAENMTRLTNRMDSLATSQNNLVISQTELNKHISELFASFAANPKH